MLKKTATYYQQKVNDVLNYVNSHLDDDLNINKLADIFAISYFHFHRIVKAALNEPLGSYINRKRLELAIHLIRYSNETLNTIATRIGYNDLSAFSKAFSKEFGISPQEFRQNTDTVLNMHIDYQIGTSGKIISDIKPKTINVADRQVVYIRVKGIYGGEEVIKAWDKLIEFASENKLLGWKTELFSIYYDDPDIIPAEECISEVCLVTNKNILPVNNIKLKHVKGGQYAVFRYKGPYEQLWELYEIIYSDWLLSLKKLKLRNQPIFEKYLNYSKKVKPENLLTEVYIPVE